MCCGLSWACSTLSKSFFCWYQDYPVPHAVPSCPCSSLGPTPARSRGSRSFPGPSYAQSWITLKACPSAGWRQRIHRGSRGQGTYLHSVQSPTKALRVWGVPFNGKADERRPAVGDKQCGTHSSSTQGSALSHPPLVLPMLHSTAHSVLQTSAMWNRLVQDGRWNVLAAARDSNEFNK
jgi:hypothetical protein